VRFVDTHELCQDWHADLTRFEFCTDTMIKRFLKASDYDEEATIPRLHRYLMLQSSARNCTHSAAVASILRSNSFRYLGHNRKGSPVMCIDCSCCQRFDAKGGIETLMQALNVFYFCKFWKMVERDIGRCDTLKFPSISVLFVGGCPPVPLVRAGLQFFSEHYPGGLSLAVVFEPSSAQQQFDRTAFKFLSKGSTEYHWTNKRARLFEILDVDEGVISDSVLYTNVCDFVDYNAFRTDALICEQLATPELMQDGRQHYGVRNTHARDTSPNGCGRPFFGRVDTKIAHAILDDVGGAPGLSLPVIARETCNEPRVRGKPQVSGWTRRRRRRAIQKANQGSCSEPESSSSASLSLTQESTSPTETVTPSTSSTSVNLANVCALSASLANPVSPCTSASECDVPASRSQPRAPGSASVPTTMQMTCLRDFRTIDAMCQSTNKTWCLLTFFIAELRSRLRGKLGLLLLPIFFIFVYSRMRWVLKRRLRVSRGVEVRS